MNGTHTTNGLSWSLAKTHGEVVSIYLWCRTGAYNETPEQAGAAHFVEHMLFKGTHRHGVGDIAKEIEGYGGDVNAYTSHDETVLHATVPVEAWQSSTATLFDMMWSSTFLAKDVHAEREVILEEVASYRDDPHSVLEDANCALMFGNHPYGRPVIGHQHTVEALTHEQLVAFWRQHYRPSRCHLAIAGPVEQGVLARWLSSNVPTRPADEILPTESAMPSAVGHRVHLQEAFDTQLAILAWRGPPSSHPDQASLAVLASLMGQGHASVLDVHLKMRDELASDVWCEQDTMRHGSVWSTLLLPLPGNCDRAIDTALAHIEQRRVEPPSLDAVERAKTGLLTDLMFTNETTDGVAHDMAWHQHHMGSQQERHKWPRAIASVTPQGVLAAAQRWLPMERAVITSIGPQTTAARYRKPSKPPSKASATNPPPAFRKFPSPNNAGDGVAAIHVACFGGGLLEVSPTAGTGLAWSQTVLAGTATRTEENLVTVLDQLGAAVEPYVTKSVTGITMTLPARNVQRGAELLGEILAEPSLGEQAWERNRAGMQEELRTQDDRPNERMSERAWQRLWAQHPWRLPPSGTMASVARIRHQDLQRYHRRCFHSGRLFMTVSGDVVAEPIRRILEGCIPVSQGTHDVTQTTRPSRPRTGTARLAAGHQQALLAWHVVTPPARDPQHYPLALGNLILGGQAGRLFDVLRERNPLAYSVWATRSTGLDGGIGSYGLATTPEQVHHAKKLLHATLQQMADEGPTAEELLRAKRMVLGGAAIRLQRSTGRAAAKLRAEMYGLPSTRAQLQQQLAPISRQDVHTAMATVLRSDGLWVHVTPS